MFHSSIAIDAPPEAVFDELAHVERHPAWANAKGDMTMEQVAGDGPGADAEYRSTGIFTKSRVSANVSRDGAPAVDCVRDPADPAPAGQEGRVVPARVLA